MLISYLQYLMLRIFIGRLELPLQVKPKAGISIALFF